MNDIFGQIKDYLPKYLSPGALAKLFKELEQFPENIDQRIYSRMLSLEPKIYQGDGIADLLVVNLPDTNSRTGKCLVLSNSCDITPNNRHHFEPRLAYCPMIRFSKLQALIEGMGERESQAGMINDIRRQRFTTLFYLPKGVGLDEDYVALLDQCLNCVLSEERYVEYSARKLFTLSDYGFFLFLFKLSIHFMRITENLERKVE